MWWWLVCGWVWHLPVSRAFWESSFAECLEVASICGVKMVKEIYFNFSTISHLFPPRILKLGCKWWSFVFLARSLVLPFLSSYYLHSSLHPDPSCLHRWQSNRGNQEILDFYSFSKAEGAMCSYRKWQSGGEDNTWLGVAVPENPASSACLAKSFTFKKCKSGQCSPSRHFKSRLAISS